MQTWMMEDVPVSDDSGACTMAGTLPFPLCYLKSLTRAFLLILNLFFLFSFAFLETIMSV